MKLETEKTRFRTRLDFRIASSAVACLAFSINFGVALVSLSCLFILLVSIYIWLGEKLSAPKLEYREITATSWAILIALAWIYLSITWTISTSDQIGIGLMRYSRLLVIPFVYYLLRTPEQGFRMITIWVYGQLFVLLSSYMLWLGLPAPWALEPSATTNYTPYSSTLETPIMSALMFSVLWFFKDFFKKQWNPWVLYLTMGLTLFNIFFIMIGRSGFLSMILVLTFIAWWLISKKYRWLVLLLPFFLGFSLFLASPKFHARVISIYADVKEFQQGKLESSQATRLEFWKRSVQAIVEKPLIGYGVGSWPLAYQLALKGEVGMKADSPHQQYFLWWVEGGTIGLICLLGIFAAIYKDSLALEESAGRALITVLAVLCVVSLMNCPLEGAGISEYFCFVIAALLCVGAKATSAHSARPFNPRGIPGAMHG